MQKSSETKTEMVAPVLTGPATVRMRARRAVRVGDQTYQPGTEFDAPADMVAELEMPFESYPSHDGFMNTVNVRSQKIVRAERV